MEELPIPLRRVDMTRPGIDLVLDIDATLLLAMPSGEVPPGVTTEFVSGVRVAIRPFVRLFLARAAAVCRSVSIWTNGSSEWAMDVALRVFPETPWTAVLDRRHSMGLEKHLSRLFMRRDYPMRPDTTLLVDDDPLHARVNPKNVIPIKPMRPDASISTDTELVRVGMALGIFDPLDTCTEQLAEADLTIMNRVAPLTFDPKPFGLTNQKSVCYFNALAQVLLRTPTIMRIAGVRGQSLAQWRDRVLDALGEGQQDASEALLHILPEASVFSPSLTDGTSKDEEVPKGKPVCLMTMPAGGISGDAFRRAFMWHFVEGQEASERRRRVRLKFPKTGVDCVVIMVHRNTAGSAKDDKVLVPSPRIITPDGQTYALCGAVLHTGSARFGHYTSIFFRHNGQAWLANDTSLQSVPHPIKALPSMGRSVSMLIYDKCGSCGK